MTDSYLTQLEVKIEQLLTHCDSLEKANSQMRLQLNNTHQTEQENRTQHQQLISQNEQLEQDLQTLIAREERARISEQQALYEKANLVQLNDQTKNQISKMISRLKTLEQNA
ncbi:hypothetical protein WN093_08230 [Gammaproteobacteria bacterium AS21]